MKPIYYAYSLIDRYCDGLTLKGRKYRTTTEYRYRLRMIVNELDAAGLNVAPSRIGMTEVHYILDTVMAGKSVKYRHHTMSILSKWLRITARNTVVDDMDLLWPHAERRVTWITPEQLLFVLDSTTGVDHIIVHLAGQLGLRCSEVAELRLSDIQLPWIYILGKGHMEGKLGKVYMHPDTPAALAQWYTIRARIVEQSIRDNPGKPIPQTLLIHNTRRKGAAPYVSKSLTKRMEHLSDVLGIRFSMHTFRRAYATTMRAAGCDVMTIRDAMRHEDIKTTMLYFQQDDGPMIRAREAQYKFEEEKRNASKKN